MLLHMINMMNFKLMVTMHILFVFLALGSLGNKSVINEHCRTCKWHKDVNHNIHQSTLSKCVKTIYNDYI
jgi:phosphoribosyl 1,2-cyclic phosphodiesterase